MEQVDRKTSDIKPIQIRALKSEFDTTILSFFTRHFLRGSANRRSPLPTIATTTASTRSSTRKSRPTAAFRRKYLTRTTTKTLESQETTTTQKPKFNHYEFVSRRPPFLRRTFKPKVAASSPNTLTQKYEKTEDLENDSIGKPLELRDVVIALKDIQNAPLPTDNAVYDEILTEKVLSEQRERTTRRRPAHVVTTEIVLDKASQQKTTTKKYVPEKTSRRPAHVVSTEKNLDFPSTVKFNASEITFTTSRPLRFKYRSTESTPNIKFDRIVATTPATKTYFTSPTPYYIHTVRQSTPHTIANSSPFVTETNPADIINRIHPSLVSNPYSNEYNTFGNTNLGYQQFGHTNILDQLPEHTKVLVHSNGVIECLDQGNFPHPVYCKKFISCAKMENGKMLGWEYTCPKNLSFDPIGGMCNWSADLGCDET